MTQIRKTKTLEGVQFRDIDFNSCIERGVPCVFKGALDSSRLVSEGRQSTDAAMSYLSDFKSELPLLFYAANADANTRFFYNEEVSDFNYTTGSASLADILRDIAIENKREDPGSVYVGSTEVDEYFPGLLDASSMRIPAELGENYRVFAGIWLGNRTTAATHYDISNNAAVCAVGRRRFTLFPPDQIANLYPGPLEPTPGGQVVSMVNLSDPDFDKYPNFVQALATAEVAELGPGDVLVYPAMWWHQVEALSDFNVLINYWWNAVPGFIDDPMNTLRHGLLSLRDRPDHEKKAWRTLFDYYVFGDSDVPRRHLPNHSLGALGELDETSARRLRARLLKKINR